MGFGIMFLGYFAGFVMFLGRLSYLRVLGGIVICFSALKLRAYNRRFDLLVLASVINTIFYMVLAATDIFETVTCTALLGTTVMNFLAICDIPVTFFFHAAMLFSIRCIAKETDSENILFASTRNLIFYCILLLLQLITLLPFTITRNLSVLSMIFSLVLSIFNLVLIFKCYAGICDSSDVNMERKPSRFAFVNKQREVFERRRQEVDKAYWERKRERSKNKRRK